MRGGAPFKTPWPKENTTLPRDDRIALQKRLATLGYDVKLFNGPITFEQRDFIRAEQAKLGMLPDGHAERRAARQDGYQAKIAYRPPFIVPHRVLGFQAGHLQQVTQRVQAMVPGDDREIAAQLCNVGGRRLPVANL